jgi:RNA polymerase sigma-70 factor (family 1)
VLPTAAEYELLTGLIQGERKAFDSIYQAYVQPIYVNAMKVTRNAALAEDIVQEVFLALWEKRMTIDATRSVGSWLFVVCYNKSVNALRKQLQETIALRELPQTNAKADDSATFEIQWQILEQAIASLSPQKRKVFELCKLQGKSYEETAKVMHLSRHTVKEYLSGAVACIKEYVHLHPESSVALTLGTFLCI